MNETIEQPEDPAKLMAADLARSGLTSEDMRARLIGPAERQSTGTPINVSGYAIPYFDVKGGIIKFYRVKLINWSPKYRQIANESNHIYFPPGFAKALSQSRCILLVEGEKKAACAIKHGFAAVAVSGVDSWRNRTITMPKDSELSSGKDGAVVVKIPSGSETTERTDSLATGMFELIDLINKLNRPLVICFDTEKGGYMKREVAIAAAQLGYELRYRGVAMGNIRSMKLKAPSNSFLDKVGLDDFLMSEEPLHGPDAFEEQLDKCLALESAFPLHPNPREYVNKRLQNGRMDRRGMQTLSTALLSDLDAKGRRLRCPDDDQLYYFGGDNKELTRVNFRIDENFARSPFGVKMYKDYNLSISDQKVLQWLATQYTGEEPLMQVRPKKIMAVKGDQLYYQINGSSIARITADNITFIDNGQHDILFESEAVTHECGVDDIKKGLVTAQKLLSKDNKGQTIVHNMWYDAIKEARVKESEDDRDRKILSLLYSISPWFYRWRGTQLPVEMTIGEPGSGKSSLYMLRLNILQGFASLKNAPHDLKDWSASVGATGGLHVTDNVHMTNATLRQELSDEMCRVVTEPSPYIEKRKLYSDFELVRVPVECVFAITALQQPFNNADIIARSIIVELDKGEDEVEYDTNWVGRQLDRYGREGWLGNQFLFQQRMFQKIKQEWIANYKARYRLVNVEQLLILAAEVYGWDGSWIPAYLDNTAKERIAAGDMTLAGLKSFAEEWFTVYGKKPFKTKDVSDWAIDEEDFKERRILTNSRSLGKYIKGSGNKVATITGIVEWGERANCMHYYIDPDKIKKLGNN